MPVIVFIEKTIKGKRGIELSAFCPFVKDGVETEIVVSSHFFKPNEQSREIFKKRARNEIDKIIKKNA